MKKRDLSIDTLRGLAILGMVLSGTIAQMVDIPGWMYHAQVGPPDFVFHPENPGITWVDLVFPFFLFTMGLAFPFSMEKSLERAQSRSDLFNIIGKIMLRTVKLFIFAVALAHFSPYRYPESPQWVSYLMALLAFLAFFASFSKFPKWPEKEGLINLVGYLGILVLLLIRVLILNEDFSAHRNDIIILVLANMAFFGGLIWMCSRSNWYLRLLFIAIVIAWRLSASVEESWAAWLFNWTILKSINGIDFMSLEANKVLFYSANFLKYLCIVLPGSIIGDIIYRLESKTTPVKVSNSFLFYLGPILIVINLYGLYTRSVEILLPIHLALAFIYLLFKNLKIFQLSNVDRQILYWSYAWLILGLILEPFEGGIHKDPATISYFFLTTGLAGLLLLSFRQYYRREKKIDWLGFLSKLGKNPMVGYVAVSFLIIPFLGLFGILPYLNSLSTYGPVLGIFKGVILTALMTVIVVITVKCRWFWKT